MKRKIRVAQWGIGAMGSTLIRYTLEHGGEIVAAFARNPSQIGRDVGEVARLAPLGVKVSDIRSADQILRAARPDICLIAAQGSVEANMEPYLACARAGVDAISIGEDCMWPYTKDATLIEQLDRIAKENGCTLSASGHPEVSWGSMVTSAAATMARLERIKGDTMLNADDYGAAVNEPFGMGLTRAEFEERFPPAAADEGEPGSGPGDQNGYLCASMGLTVTKQVVSIAPLVSRNDLFSKSFDRVIPAGRVIGFYHKCRTMTAEGITMDFWAGGKIHEAGESNWNRWTFFGEPREVVLEFDTPGGGGPAFTCAPPIHRIPDVINAQPGFITTNRLPALKYLSKPLNAYVTSIDE